MVPIKELIPLIKNAKEVRIAWAGASRAFNIIDQIETEAYGDYMCDQITTIGEDAFELQIAFRPIKVTEV